MATAKSTDGVYASLDELVRLRSYAKGFSFLPKQPINSLLAGRHASRLRGRGLNFEEFRKYLPGDDIRQIDWKVTARTRKPHSRVYTEERERPVILLVDQRIGMFFGSRLNLKSVTACEIAAIAAWRTIAVQDRIGAVVFNDESIQGIRPHRSQTTVMQILQSAIDMNHVMRADSTVRSKPEMLNEALRHTLHLAKHDCLVVMITDGTSENEETTQLVTEIARHNDVLIAFVFDPLEADLPTNGSLIFSDGGRQLAIDGRSATLRQQYQADFVEHRRKAKEFLLTREVPVIPVSAAEPTLAQLAAALGRTPRRRR